MTIVLDYDRSEIRADNALISSQPRVLRAAKLQYAENLLTELLHVLNIKDVRLVRVYADEATTLAEW